MRVLKRCRSEFSLTVKQTRQFQRRFEKVRNKENSAAMHSLVKSIETSLSLPAASLNQINPLDDKAKKENKQLLNELQQQCSSNVHHEAPALSTVSMVHLQYKYEELLASHEGLLKLLESKVKEVRKCYVENEQLHKDLKATKQQAKEVGTAMHVICDKYLRLKERKNEKIARVKSERDNIRLAHNQLVHLLHKKCMEQDDFLFRQQFKTHDSSKCLLISEIRRVNKLQFENVMLIQENGYLHEKLLVSRRKCDVN